MLAVPELGDFATCDADDVYPAHGHAPARGLDAHELAAVGAAHGEAADDFVPLGDQILYCFAHVWESGPPRGDQRGQSFAPGRRARERMVIIEVLRDQLEYRLQVSLAQERLLEAAPQRLVAILFAHLCSSRSPNQLVWVGDGDLVACRRHQITAPAFGEITCPQK